MSINTLSKTVADSVYAYRLVRLMQKSFSDWDACKLGLIDKNGSILKRPKTDAEKEAYTPFHASIRAIKRTLSTVPGAFGLATLTTALSALSSRYSMTESDWRYVSDELGMPIYETMVAGDAGNGTGSPLSIASGETTGDLTNGVSVRRKIKKRKISLINLDK